ncbi:MAG: hypothetical protein QXQ77_02445 [Candidatus Aenigmatarchaeota archaeon]
MKLKEEKYKSDFYLLLFDEFKRKIPSEFLFFDKTIPFHSVRIILSRHRYSSHQIKAIVRAWRELGLISYVKFRGIKLAADGNGR